MIFEREEQGMRAASLTPEADGHIWFRANNIRKERTGLHATTYIFHDTARLKFSQFNIERDEDRARLANAAWADLDAGLQKKYVKAFLRHDFDTFCDNLWPNYVNTAIPEKLAGDATQTPIEFLLRPYIMRGGGTILFGPAGRGKSYSSQLIAVSVDAGVDQLWPVTQTNTLLVNLERSAISIARRIGCVNTVLGLNPARSLAVINARGKSLQTIQEVVAETIKRYEIEFVVLDSISRAGFGDLTENRPVNAIVDMMNNLCDTWLALAHTPRADSNHIFGSVLFEAGADIMLQLLSQLKGTQSLGVGLQVTKANDMAPTGLSVYGYEFDEYGLSAARIAHPREYLEIEAQRRIETSPAIRDYLLDVGPATVEMIADAVSKDRTTVQKILKNSPTFMGAGFTGSAQLWTIREKNVSK